MVVEGQKSDARALRAHAAQFRACALATGEAERQRIFPVLAEDCEARADELEQRAEEAESAA